MEKKENIIFPQSIDSLQGGLVQGLVGVHECVLACSPGGMDSLSLISMDTNRFFTADVSL